MRRHRHTFGDTLAFIAGVVGFLAFVAALTALWLLAYWPV